jgi:hypothetical protein
VYLANGGIDAPEQVQGLHFSFVINKKTIMKGFIVGVLCTMCIWGMLELESIKERIDRINVEYQFVVTDDSLSVYDANRYVGSTMLEGGLEHLINNDNQ